MADTASQAPDYGSKDLGAYNDLGRGPTTSYFRKLAASTGHAPDANTFSLEAKAASH